MDDHVLRNVRGEKQHWQADAVRSARWRQRTSPRPCDAWAEILDITRGNLRDESADEYDEWYASLTPREVDNCRVLTTIEARVGSKAPWYLYELKHMNEPCSHDPNVGDLDWVAWYRGLLEKATGASAGRCVSDWERWWAAKGYPPIPDPPVLSGILLPFTTPSWLAASSSR